MYFYYKVLVSSGSMMSNFIEQGGRFKCTVGHNQKFYLHFTFYVEKTWEYYRYVRCELKKTHQNVFFHIFHKTQSILIKFGTNCPE